MNTLFFFLWNLHIVLESLPISSSSHIHLLNKYLARISKYTPVTISTTLDYLMHIPTALVLKATLIRHYALLSDLSLFHWIATVCIADLVTGTTYLVMKKKGKPPLPFSAGFFISACALLSLYFVPYGTIREISFFQAFLIGCVQSLTLFPGISRLALTFVASIYLGIDPLIGALFSLSIELALICVALAKAGYDLFSHTHIRAESTIDFSISRLFWLAISTLISFGLLQLVLSSMVHKTIVLFGWYLLILAFCV